MLAQIRFVSARVSVVAVLISGLPLVSGVMAGDLTVPLLGNVYEIERLGPDAPSASITFSDVDASPPEKITFHLRLPSSAINTYITGPAGQEVNPTNIVGAFGGSYVSYETGGVTGSLPILLPFGPGFHKFHELQSFRRSGPAHSTPAVTRRLPLPRGD